MGRTIIRGATVLVLVLVLAACATSSTQGPTAWVDQPLDGKKLPLGPQELTAHASDLDGVTTFEFYVDGALLLRAPAGGGLLEHTTVGWSPSTRGVYTISVRGTDSQGNVGAEAKVVVTVGELEGTATASPTVLPTEETVPLETPSPGPPAPQPTSMPPTRTPLAATPQLTSAPPTRTPQPPPPTPTVPARAPQITYLEANPGTIDSGGCSTVRWGVEYAAEVYLDGEGVVDHDSRQVCPARTTTYSLLARSPGGEQSASVKVTVRQPPSPTPIVIVDTPEPQDNTPPDISNVSLSEPRIHILSECGSACPCTVVIKARVTDESGVWAVVAELKLGGSPKGTMLMGPSGSDFYEAELGPFTQAGNLVITIVAQDFAGNTGRAERGITVWDSCLG